MSAYQNPHADYLIDRRRLRRKVTFWRAFATTLALVLIFAVWARMTGDSAPGPGVDHVARIKISGLITADDKTMEMIERLGRSRARAIVLNIDSPGGTTAGAERLFDELRRLNEKIPVAAVVGTVGASGAYIAALSSDHIVARGNSLVGSIGVLVQVPNVARLLDSIGVKVDAVRSSPLKASPSGLEPTPPEALAALAAVVDDSHEWFRKLVQDRRGLSASELDSVADGRIFTGRQSLELKLIDAIGGEREAIAWLEREKNVAADLPVRDWRPESRSRLPLWRTAAMLAQAAGMTDLAEILRRSHDVLETVKLDGVLAVWQGGELQ